MSKKVLALCAACLLLAFALFGCQSQQQAEPQFEANVSKVFATTSYDGSTTLLVINLDVKNNSDMSLNSYSVDYYATATHGGNTLTSSYLPDNNPEALTSNASIAVGETGVAQLVYEIDSLTGTVEFVVKVDDVEYRDVIEVVNETIELSKVTTVESKSAYDVKLDRTFITDDGDGKDLLVLELTFTNNSDSATSFGMAINASLFQNGVQLNHGYLPYDHPEANDTTSYNSSTDIKQGASIQIQTTYELNDDQSDVEIELIDNDSFDKKVLYSNTIELDNEKTS